MYADITDSHIKKLQMQQNKIIKMIYNLSWRTSSMNVEERNIELVETFAERLRGDKTSMKSNLF